MNLDQRIYEAVVDSPAENPKELSDIIGYIDAREKLIVSYSELRDGLRRWVESHKVIQKPGNYVAAPKGYTPKEPVLYQDFSEDEYHQAVKKYTKRFWKTYKQSKPDA